MRSTGDEEELVRIKANALLIISPGRGTRTRTGGEVFRAKKNTERAKVMREAVEYAVGIFHGSIMAIQSGGRRNEVEFVILP